MQLDPKFLKGNAALEVRAWIFRDANGNVRIPCQVSGDPAVPDEADVNNDFLPVGKLLVWVQQFDPSRTQVTPDLRGLRGTEARLLVRESFDFLRSLGYHVVEQAGSVPNNRAEAQSNGHAASPAGQKEPEVQLLKVAAMLATLATVAKILYEKWSDLF
ncbi:MAG: hypothetical protein JNN08_16830 [Bryobacterales bacterium]|nr:hypothetical protein [Bryobacterales bacterium]